MDEPAVEDAGRDDGAEDEEPESVVLLLLLLPSVVDGEAEEVDWAELLSVVELV